MLAAEALAGALRPMEPIPTGIEPKLSRLLGIESVVFDVYGTLLISETGDIAAGDEAGPVAPTRELSALLGEFDVRMGTGELAAAFAAEVRAEQERRYEQEPYPEVDAGRIWTSILGLAEEEALLFSAAWEASVNRVWTMPGAAATLRALRSEGFRLGIVSNAQAYTPPLFQLVLGETVEEFGFESDMVFFSWKEGRSKPSPRLFGDLVTALGKAGIEASKAVFIGNDMLKDMMPARAAGLRTCLFAGDRRSLKLRTEDPRCAFEPDAVIHSLDQLRELVAACPN